MKNIPASLFYLLLQNDYKVSGMERKFFAGYFPLSFVYSVNQWFIYTEPSLDFI